MICLHAVLWFSAIIFHLVRFSHQLMLVVFPWILSDIMSPGIFSVLLPTSAIQQFELFQFSRWCFSSHLLLFHISVSWWFFTGVWGTASLLKSPGLVSSNLVVLSNVIVWIVSTRPPTSKSSRPFKNPSVIVPYAPITIDTIVTFMFRSFFNSLARSRYLSSFSLSFIFIHWPAGTAKSTILQILFYFCWLI